MVALVGTTTEEARVSEMYRELSEDAQHAVFLFVQALYWCRGEGKRARQFSSFCGVVAKALFDTVSDGVEIVETL